MREQSTSGVFLLLCSVRSFVRERLLCIAFRSFRFFFFLLSLFLCHACSADYSANVDEKRVTTELRSPVNQVNGFLYVTSGLKNFSELLRREKNFMCCCYCLQGCRCRDTNFYLYNVLTFSGRQQIVTDFLTPPPPPPPLHTV